MIHTLFEGVLVSVIVQGFIKPKNLWGMHQITPQVDLREIPINKHFLCMMRV